MIKKILLALLLLVTFPVLADTIPIETNQRSTVDVQVQISGAQKTFPFLLDTGSGYTVLPGVPVDGVVSKKIEGITADGKKSIVQLYTIPSLKLGNCLVRDVEIAAIPGAGRPILGMEVIKRLGHVDINFQNKTMTFDCPTGNEDGKK